MIEAPKRPNHILNIAAVVGSKLGRQHLVRLSQDNWHRIIESAQGSDFDFFCDVWKEYLMKWPGGKMFVEQCDVCLEREDPAYKNKPDVRTKIDDILQRPRVYSHLLKPEYPYSKDSMEIEAERDWSQS